MEIRSAISQIKRGQDPLEEEEEEEEEEELELQLRAIADVALGGHVEMAAILIASSRSPSPKYPRY